MMIDMQRTSNVMRARDLRIARPARVAVGRAALLLLFILLFGGGLLRAQRDDAPRPLGELLDSTGALAVPAGYDGALDPAGWRLAGSRRGALRFVREDEPASSSSLSVDDDIYWDDRFGDFPIDGDIEAMVVDGDDIYIGGEFDRVESITAHHVARWNGAGWQRLGDGVDGNVYALAVSNGQLFVGGEFRNAGGVSANRIAVWNNVTASWRSLANGVDDTGYAYVGALAANGGEIYVGGGFSRVNGMAAANIASWNSANGTWSPLGAGVDGDVLAIVTRGDALYAGGSFASAGGAPARNIALWSRSGSRWTPLGAGVHGWVNALAYGPDGSLYVGGKFDSVGTIASGNLAIWGNDRWTANTGRLSLLVPLALSTLRDTVTVLDSAVRGIVVGNDGRVLLATWMRSLGGYANVVASSSSSIFIAGTFRSASNGAIKGRIFRNDDGSATWRTLGNRINAPVTAMAARNGEIWVAGGYDLAAKTGSTTLAKWDGSGWTPIVTGIRGTINALLFDGGELYAGGQFSLIGGHNVGNIAKLDIANNSWSALDLGVTTPDPLIVAGVSALALHGRDLYVGGAFQQIGSAHAPASNLARWNLDEGKWYPMENDFSGTVRALAFSPAGELFAGGSFSAGDRSHSKLARWDGARWSSVGGGVNDDVDALLFVGSDLYVGGEFTLAGTDSARRIARWDGTSWSTLGRGVEGTGMFPRVAAMGTMGSYIFAAGAFAVAGGDSIANVARWDGRRWWPLGSGIDAAVDAMAIVGRDLYASGSFLMAGSKPSINFAHWTMPVLSVGEPSATIPAATLDQNIPNPATRSTLIRYRIERPGDVSLVVSDLLGRRVAVLVAGRRDAGEHEVRWDLESVPPGAYFYRIETADGVAVRGMVVE
jgi:hypothetical protein